MNETNCNCMMCRAARRAVSLGEECETASPERLDEICEELLECTAIISGRV